MRRKRSGSDPPNETQFILADANVLINFLHIGQLDLLGNLSGYRFVIPEHVEMEITRKAQAAVLKRAIKKGILELTVITDIQEMADYTEFHKTLGQGESACLAIAVNRGFSIASDEKGVFRKLVLGKIGQTRLLTTPDLILTAVQSKLVTVAQADNWKAKLEMHRFKMKFLSFKDLL
jgi:predicted nucleic acid-binding protein